MEPGRNRQEDNEEDSVKGILVDDELSQLLKFVPRDEFENLDREKARQFLAKELSGSSKGCVEQRPELIGKRRRSPSAKKIGGESRRKFCEPKSDGEATVHALLPGQAFERLHEGIQLWQYQKGT